MLRKLKLRFKKMVSYVYYTGMEVNADKVWKNNSAGSCI